MTKENYGSIVACLMGFITGALGSSAGGFWGFIAVMLEGLSMFVLFASKME